MQTKIIIGSRGSELALWQANHVAEALIRHGYLVEIKIIKTRGDQIQHLGFDKMEGKGFFTKELEDALLANEIDLAVHSCKDLSTAQPDGLGIGAIFSRESPADLLVIHPEALDPAMPYQLKKKAVVGTSSIRRKNQLRWLRPDVNILDVRGNVPTRLQKLRDKQFDAILLAAAGIHRLGLLNDDFIFLELNSLQMVPAPAQGALALQIRINDEKIKTATAKLHQSSMAEKVAAERAMLSYFQGGCQLPLGCLCEQTDNDFYLKVSYSKDGSKAPMRVKVRASHPLELSSMAHAILFSCKPCRVLISAASGRYSQLVSSLNDNGFSIEQHSFIECLPLPKKELNHAEWIYFNSPASVEMMVREYAAYLVGKKIACAGEGTANTLNQLGYAYDYQGGDLDPGYAAMDFVGKHKPQDVFMPVSNISLGTAKKIFSQHTIVTSEVIYETVSRPVLLQNKPDILVLTSPSQAHSYFSQYRDDGKTKYLVNGEKSRRAVLSYVSSDCVFMSENSHQVSLLESIYQICAHETH
jgi:hydroxymethylbilane synthase